MPVEISLRRMSLLAVVAATLMLLVSLAGSVAAQSEPVVVVQGSDTAYGTNQFGDAPMITYEEGDNPPYVMAQQIGDGKVIGGGFAATMRGGAGEDQNWRDNEFEFFMDAMFQWLTGGKAPSDTTVLWHEGYRVYNNTDVCRMLIDNMEAMGYTIEGKNTTPMADIDLSSYDIVIIPQWQEWDSIDVESEVNTLQSYVEGGGGLIVASVSDYYAQYDAHFSKRHNQILVGIGAGFSFQHDQAEDPGNNMYESYAPVGIANTDTSIGESFQSQTGSTEVGLYSTNTMKFGTGPALNVDLSPSSAAGFPDETVSYEALITYKGSGDNLPFTLSSEDNQGWIQSVSKNEVKLSKNETENVTVEVKVPEGVSEKKKDYIKLTATGDQNEASDEVLIVSAVPKERPPYPIAQARTKDNTSPLYWFSTATLLVEDPAVPIVTGRSTGFSNDMKPREPVPLLYGKEEYPPAMAAAMIGDGRVLVDGGGSSFRSVPSDWYAPIGSEAGERLARWMVNWKDPRNQTWLYYTPVSGNTSAFHDPARMSVYLDMLDNGLGFNLITENGDTSNITPELLDNVDVFQFSGGKNKGTEVLSFTDNAINNLIDWVNEGGSLYVLSRSDYSGYSDVEPQNRLLSELGAGIMIQDDQLTDENVFYQPEGSHFPGVYFLDAREANSNFDMWWPNHAVGVKVPEAVVRGKGGTTENLIVKVSNTGLVDTTIGLEFAQTTEMENWEEAVTSEVSEVDVASGETKRVTVNVQIPEVTELTRTEWEVTATDLNRTYLSSSAPVRVLGEKAPEGKSEGGEGGEGGGLPWAMVGGAIAAAVIVVGAGFVVMRK